MMRLPTTLLRHDAPGQGVAPHYDWLINDPQAQRDPASGLWTARVSTHWNDWIKFGQIELTALPRHRRRYLSWEGKLSGNRGWVWSAGRGHAVLELWTPHRVELTLEPIAGYPNTFRPGISEPPAILSVSLRRTGHRWRGIVSPRFENS